MANVAGRPLTKPETYGLILRAIERGDNSRAWLLTRTLRARTANEAAARRARVPKLPSGVLRTCKWPPCGRPFRVPSEKTVQDYHCHHCAALASRQRCGRQAGGRTPRSVRAHR